MDDKNPFNEENKAHDYLRNKTNIIAHIVALILRIEVICRPWYARTGAHRSFIQGEETVMVKASLV